jgi:hypothetical protein
MHPGEMDLAPNYYFSLRESTKLLIIPTIMCVILLF